MSHWKKVWKMCEMKVCVKMKTKSLWELPKCRERQRVGKSVGKNGADRLAWCRVPQNLQFVKRMQYLQRAIKGSSRRRGMPVSIMVLIYIAVGSRKGQYTSKG